MKKGFYTDHVGAVLQLAGRQRVAGRRHRAAEDLKRAGLAAPALVPMFALFYVVLAPFVGAFADAVPKGKVMFVSQQRSRCVGCLLMLFGGHPLLVVRDRRARRGGVLAGQVRHPHRAAAAVAAGQGQRLDRGADDRLDHPRRAARRPAGRRRASRRCCWASTCRCSTPASTPRPKRRSPSIVLLYVDRRRVQPLHPAHRGAAAADARGIVGLVRDFSQCNARLWADKLGQISLATTTLFWGVVGQPARHRAGLGRGGARLQHDAGVVAGRRGGDRHRRRRGRRRRC